MRGDSGATRTPWFASVDTPPRPPLTGETRADVCVIGAGITGMSAAYMLAREGRAVVVIDDGPIGGGQTGRTTAHLSNAIDDLYQTIEKIHGGDGARLAAESHSAAIERIETIAAAEGIDCDFERLDGYLFARPGESDEVLRAERVPAAGAVVFRWSGEVMEPIDRIGVIGRNPSIATSTARCVARRRRGAPWRAEGIALARDRRKEARMATRKRRTTSKKRGSQKRDLVKGRRATSFAKRTARGRFKEMDERGRSLKSDRRRKSKTKSRSGYGDRGDRAA